MSNFNGSRNAFTHNFEKHGQNLGRRKSLSKTFNELKCFWSWSKLIACNS